MVAICVAEFAKEVLHRIGSLEGEPCIDASIIELARQATKDETAKHASISGPFRVTLAVRETPFGEADWSKILGKAAVTTCQGNGITEHGTARGISYVNKMSSVKGAER